MDLKKVVPEKKEEPEQWVPVNPEGTVLKSTKTGQLKTNVPTPKPFYVPPPPDQYDEWYGMV